MLLRTVYFFLTLLLLTATPARAEESETTAGEEYDFSWLDPEKKIYVVQNRKYLKKNRLELALGAGFGFGQPYRKSYTFIPRATFYLNESWGFSVLAGFNSNSENENFASLQLASTTFPAVRDVQNFVSGSLMWIPFYGKINIFNQILYIDWHVEAGFGQANTEIDLNTRRGGTPNILESSHAIFHWGTGQKFFITRNFAARLDFLAQYYKAPTGLLGSVTDGIGADPDIYDNYYVTLGLAYTF